ncbi:terminase large subunit domain-containing protein [Catenuloplanes atrovinosus]|uniref:Terminase large subunit-like ATPase domain-containing protein n=1 Tax=Catenuloplanes atrovinosus TaxID=137266 RepID=A0AAE4CES8_9ACTN|nr:terminase large subunit [Catenuloplanes atrovinosus]MDR7278925.1 hypothetical protein [Catenuloplanes atrovinosus]
MTVIDLAAAERPRVLHVPRFSTSAGEEAIDLAAQAGLFLDPWQAFVLRNALGERADGRWAAFQVGLIVARQQGKGSVLEARELAGLVLFGEELIVHTAHQLKTSMKHFRRLERLFDGSDDLRKRIKKITRSNGKEGMEMANGAILECIARSKDSGRGYTGDLVVLDEAYALTEEQMDATMPVMLAVDNAQVWYTSSPPLDAVSGQVLMGIRDRAEAGTADRLAWFDYGLPGSLDQLETVDLDDRAAWYAALPSLRSGRIREENVQVMRDSLTDKGFAREILGMWPPGLAGGFQIISEANWTAALDPGSVIEGPVALAAAVSVDRQRASIAACGARADGRLHVELTSTPLRVDNRAGTGWVVPRLADLVCNNDVVSVVMDEYGPTGSLIPAAEEAGIEVTRIGTAAAARAYGMFYDGIAGVDPASRVLNHIGQPELTAAIAGAKNRRLGDGYAWDRRSPDVDITPVVAATNALLGWATRPQVDDQPFNIW